MKKLVFEQIWKASKVYFDWKTSKQWVPWKIIQLKFLKLWNTWLIPYVITLFLKNCLIFLSAVLVSFMFTTSPDIVCNTIYCNPHVFLWDVLLPIVVECLFLVFSENPVGVQIIIMRRPLHQTITFSLKHCFHAFFQFTFSIIQLRYVFWS